MSDEENNYEEVWDVAEEWTPGQGVCRGLLWGGMAALVLALISCALAWYLPPMVLKFWMRAPGGLFTAWVLFLVVHRAAGMTSSACTVIVAALSVLIALSHHVVFAVHGVPGERLHGWAWFSPEVLVLTNIPAALGIVFGLCAWKDGATITSFTDLLGSRPGA